MGVIVFARDLINLAVLLSAGIPESSWIASGRMESLPSTILAPTGTAGLLGKFWKKQMFHMMV